MLVSYTYAMKSIEDIDIKIIHFFQRISMPAGRIALFIVFFWFGILKVIGVSPAGPLVQMLAERTIPFIPFHAFYIFFALLECAIGLMFIIPKMERIVIPLLFLHMITTFIPLFALPHEVWQMMFVPTLEGQYIIKNVVIIATAIGVASSYNSKVITPLLV